MSRILNRKFLRFFAALAVTVSIFIFLLSKVSFSSILVSLQKADFSLILVSLIISIFFNLLMDAYRWKVILNHLRYPMSFKEAFFIKAAANLFISLLPLRSGELIRLAYLKRLRDVPYAQTTLSITVEYCHKTFVLLACLFVGVCVYFLHHNTAQTTDSAYLQLPAVISLCFLNFIIPRDMLTHYNKVFKPYLKELKEALTNSRILVCNLFYSCGELINFYLLTKSLSIQIPFYSVLIFIPLIIFASALPFTVAGLGSRELSVLFLFKDYASPEVLLSLGVLYSFVEFIFPSFIGIVFTAAFTEKLLKQKYGA